MKENKIIVAGIGPGSPEDITPAVVNALKESDVVIGYKYYFQNCRSRHNSYHNLPDFKKIGQGRHCHNSQPCGADNRACRGNFYDSRPLFAGARAV